MPKVSIIVPNYNHARYLPKRLDSIFNQTYQDFEVILLDDCSTDNSVEILKQYADHPKVSIFFINKKNSGSPFKQWQKGVNLAQGEYIWIAESDDWANEKFLEILVTMLDDGSDLSYCRSIRVENEKILDINYFWADGLDNERWKKSFTNKGIDEIKKYLVYRNTIPNASACLFRKSFVKFTNELKEMRFCGDWLFWISLLYRGNISYTPLKLNYFRIHQGTSRAIKSAELEIQRIKEYFLVIKYARYLTKRKFLIPQEYHRYKWIIKQLNLQVTLNSRLLFFFPPIPISFYPLYYQQIVSDFLV